MENKDYDIRPIIKDKETLNPCVIMEDKTRFYCLLTKADEATEVMVAFHL